jgi:hypothetical protein
MNLKQALKEKNRLKGKIASTAEKIRKYNVSSDDNRPYNAEEELQNLFKLSEDMVALKSKIHRANVKKCELIFRLSELKSIAKNIQWINTTPEWKSEGDITVHKKPILDARKVELIKEDLMTRIETIQDELDSFNYQTTV